MSISSVLIKNLEKNHMTQQELAEKIDITQSYVSQICSGKKQPTISTLTKISQCLGIPLTAFFDEAPSGVFTSSGQERFLTAEEEHILSLYRSMNKKDRAVIYSMVNQIHIISKQHSGSHMYKHTNVHVIR